MRHMARDWAHLPEEGYKYGARPTIESNGAIWAGVVWLARRIRLAWRRHLVRGSRR